MVNVGQYWCYMVYQYVFTGTNREFGHEKSGFKQHNWVV